MNKYLITKTVYAKDITSALVADKKAPVMQITLIEEPEENKVGF